MKVLHILGGGINSGAGRGTYCLHKGLLELGVNSKILCGNPEKNDTNEFCEPTFTIAQRYKRNILKKIERTILNCYQNQSGNLFSTGMYGFDVTKIPFFTKADIIHLHWICKGFIDIKQLKKIRKPIIWTIRDMWPMTGGCHVVTYNNCNYFQNRCGKCRELGSHLEHDLSRWVMNRKIKYYPKDMTIVGISNWMCEMCHSSSIFSRFDIRKIENCIFARDFSVVNKEYARRKLNIPTGKKVVMTGMLYPNEKRKGFNLFVDAVKKLDPQKYQIAIFGANHINNTIFEDSLTVSDLGYIDDANMLKLAYSAADVFVSTSYEESFGKTIAESMACGTPVVCFDHSGPRDMISHKSTGYLAVPFQVNDIIKGIDFIVNNKNYKKISHDCRSFAINQFDNKIVARKYLSLYKEILANRKSSSSASPEVTGISSNEI